MIERKETEKIQRRETEQRERERESVCVLLKAEKKHCLLKVYFYVGVMTLSIMSLSIATLSILG